MSAYTSDPRVLIASADCLKAQKPYNIPGPSKALCDVYHGKGQLCSIPQGDFYPCIIYGKGDNLQLYQGSRSFSSLKQFVESHATPSPPSPPAPPSPPSPPSPPAPSPPPSPPSPSQCGSCKVCLNPANDKCQNVGAHSPKTKADCEAKGHIWCGLSTYEVYSADPVVNPTCIVEDRSDEPVVV